MTTLAENIRKIMDCRPSVNSKIYKSNQPIYFADSPVNQIGKRIEVQPLQSDNVIFPANTSLFTLCFAIGLSILFYLSRYLDYPILLIISVVMYVLYYSLVVKTFQASILIDENGVRFNSFRLKDITLNYRDIKSIRSFKWDAWSYPSKIGVFLIAVAVILALSIIFEEWAFIILVVLALPVVLLLYREEKRRYHDLDTQLYIESKKNKWWYELSPYYSVITDKTTADRISKSIEQYMEG